MSGMRRPQNARPGSSSKFEELKRGLTQSGWLLVLTKGGMVGFFRSDR